MQSANSYDFMFSVVQKWRHGKGRKVLSVIDITGWAGRTAYECILHAWKFPGYFARTFQACGNSAFLRNMRADAVVSTPLLTTSLLLSPKRKRNTKISELMN
jgi:hypothetical protein